MVRHKTLFLILLHCLLFLYRGQGIADATSVTCDSLHTLPWTTSLSCGFTLSEHVRWASRMHVGTHTEWKQCTCRFKQRTYNICRFHNSYCTQCDSVISYAEFPPSLLSVEQSHTSLTLSSATPPPPSQWNTQLQQWSQTSMYTCNSMCYRIAGNFHGVKFLFTKR